jgi:uncharacterized membrane protein
MSDHNPYEPSQVPFTPPAAIETGFLGEPRQLPAGAGLDWLSGGWKFFAEAPGVWIGIALIWMMLVIVASFLPLIGGFAASILGVVLSAGVALGCQAMRRGETLEVSHMFAGFSTNFNQLLLVGLIYIGATVLVTVVLLAVFFLGLGGMGAFTNQGQPPDTAKMGLMFLVIGVPALLLLIPLWMSVWLAPLLVALDGLPAFDAMLLSLRACLKNFLPILVYGLLVMVASILAMIPLFLGFFVLAPVLLAATYVAYRQIFFEDLGTSPGVRS